MEKVIARNVVSNWTGMAINILVAFFMMPFVIHELGNSAYGFWAVLQSLISYMFLLDFGVRSSLNRYLAKFYALNSHLEANRVINTGLVAYLTVCGGVVAISAGLGFVAYGFFSFHEIGSTTIFWVVLLVGSSVALHFPAAVFESVLGGQQRYDLMNIAGIMSLLLRTVLIILSLKMGYGLLGISLATFLGSFILLLLNYLLACRIFPSMRLDFSLAAVETFKILANHSFYAYILLGATRVITDAGIILVGVFLGPAVVTFYAIAGSLTTYATNMISAISTAIPPAASDMEARRDQEGLKALCISGTKFVLLTGLPILLTFIMSGDTFIKLWIGEGFSESYPALVLLSLGWAFNYVQTAAACILMGVSRHRTAAWLVLLQAVLNVGLSLYLIGWMGMVGVAWGALISSLVMNLIFQVHALHLLEISIGRFLAEAIIPVGMALIPFTVVLEMLFRSFTTQNLFAYFLCVGLAVGCMLMCLPWLGLNRKERDVLWHYLTRWTQQIRLSTS